MEQMPKMKIVYDKERYEQNKEETSKYRRETLLYYILHRLHSFILYLNSPLLATFYTLSFID